MKNNLETTKKVPTFLLYFYELHNLLRYGRLEFFSRVEIETSSFCNRRCSYCPNSVFDRGKKLMKEETFKKIILELKKLHYTGHIYPHHYGEPLLDKRMVDLVRYTRVNLPYVWIRIYSNGDYLTSSLLRQLVKAGVDEFFITGHDGFLPPHIKKLMQSKLGKQTIKFFKLDKSKMPLFNRGGLVKPQRKIIVKHCDLASQHLVIDYRGNVVLCCNDYLAKHKFGNLEQEQIVDIWKKSHYQKLRKEIQDGRYRLDICRKCVALSP
ncbi:MAG: radical SAM protein [Candidatus Pacebacteria bacterium]|nr:radical SAM protein [Candidatus Paceibacterota bacterium]